MLAVGHAWLWSLWYDDPHSEFWGHLHNLNEFRKKRIWIYVMEQHLHQFCSVSKQNLKTGLKSKDSRIHSGMWGTLEEPLPLLFTFWPVYLQHIVWPTKLGGLDLRAVCLWTLSIFIWTHKGLNRKWHFWNLFFYGQNLRPLFTSGFLPFDFILYSIYCFPHQSSQAAVSCHFPG